MQSNEPLERSSESVALAILAQQHGTVYRLTFEPQLTLPSNTFKRHLKFFLFIDSFS